MPGETCTFSKRATPRKPGVSAIALGLLAQQLLADHRMQPIGPDQQVRLQFVSIGEVTDDMPLL
jgi:hypothetical protein